ncbi:Hsp20/alpha crystallin family protein [Lacisediminimonas sp.]|uniref:Hsp20/alpha crystallin family protein n=1 Tax=Lacisediminimonas sp. TaxID=3060582 RepID=UPI00272879C7|nr:Hsp20/alpha crystallin family protein [Lacisediminimonas sp.]MDO8300252.1 Hsp20/alpha crystallin family protein [Lacisediminimonas sp.]
MSKSELQRGPESPTEQAGEQAHEPPAQALLPPVDVIEDATGITLVADLPGVPRDKLTLQLDTDSLTIEGEVTLDVPQGMESSHAELRVPRYRRTFKLSRELDGEKASAELKNGVLRLRIPKASHAQPRKIEVRVT